MAGRHQAFVGRIARGALALAVCSGSAVACQGGDDDEEEVVVESATELSQPAAAFPSTYARQWMTNLANSVKGDRISPPVAARTYAYGAIAIYESVVHGMPGYHSLAGQLNGLDALPLPVPGLEYDWPTVMAQTMSQVAPATYVFPTRLFFEFITPVQASLSTLGPAQIGYRVAAGVPQNVIDNSIDYGNALAGALIAWANSDGYAQARYKGWIPPTGPDKWVPTGFSDQDKVANPLEPWFGSVRPLVLAPGECEAPPPIPFSTDPASAFYAQASAVHQTETNLTDEQFEIARFWADGPGDTPTPAGHWVAITTQIVRPQSLAVASAAYAWISIGFLDSFIACWDAKYTYNLLRPETYIRNYIQSNWRSVLPTPQFPTYTSGHSTQSGASAALLTAMFGSGPFTDNTKLRRGFGPRSFANFTAAAQEAADSRLYGGIHYPMDNSAGLTQGQCVGNAIVSRVHITP
jgi:hypothetical protein